MQFCETLLPLYLYLKLTVLKCDMTYCLVTAMLYWNLT